MTIAARLLLAAAGVACLSRALPGMRPGPARTRAADPRRRLFPVLLDRVAGLLEHGPALRRAGDDVTLARRLALEPHAWPWRLAGAGSAPGDVEGAVARLAALRVVAAAAGAALAVVAFVTAGTAGFPAAAGACVLGLAGVDLATASAARQAERRIVATLPDLLDCLAAALEAGLVLEQALHLAAATAEPPLVDLLSEALTAIRLGEPPGAALRRQAERRGLPTLSAAAAVVDRGRRLGEPVAPALLAMAADARSEAACSAALHAARRSSAAALVVAVVIAPACVVAVMAVVIGGLLGAGHGVVGG